MTEYIDARSLKYVAGSMSREVVKYEKVRDEEDELVRGEHGKPLLQAKFEKKVLTWCRVVDFVETVFQMVAEMIKRMRWFAHMPANEI